MIHLMISNSNQHGLIKKREYKIKCKLNTVRNEPKKHDRLLNWRLDPYIFISTNLLSTQSECCEIEI